MAMKLSTPPTQAPSRTLPRTSGSLSIALLRILARPLGDSASPAISGTTFERSRMPPLESMIPGFSRPRGPKRTSFMDSPRAEGAVGIRGKGSCVGCPRRARKWAQLWAEWGQDNQRFGRVCPQRGLGAAYLLPIGNRRRDIVKRAVFAAFSFAIGTFRGQHYRMDLVRAPSCKRRGFGGRHTMASPLLRAVPGHLV